MNERKTTPMSPKMASFIGAIFVGCILAVFIVLTMTAIKVILDTWW